MGGGSMGGAGARSLSESGRSSWPPVSARRAAGTRLQPRPGAWTRTSGSGVSSRPTNSVSMVGRDCPQLAVSLYLSLTTERTVRRPPMESSVVQLAAPPREGRPAGPDPVAQHSPAGCAWRLSWRRDRDPGPRFDVDGAPSWAVFKSGRELNRAITLPVRVKESSTIDVDADVEPLEAVLEESAPVPVARVRVEESRILDSRRPLKRRRAIVRATWGGSRKAPPR